MNALAMKLDWLSPEEYLEGEKISEIRHEYSNGQIYAMSGASKPHNLIALNLEAALRLHLRGSPCQVFMEAVKARVKTAKEEHYYYPDVQVSCVAKPEEAYYESNPKLIIEVLSPSTERRDRAEKFYFYRKLPALEEYVLVAQDTRRVEIYRRASGWELELVAAEEAAFLLRSVGLELLLSQVYEDSGVAFVAAAE
jgi:Uma2 family endonuclease